MEKVTESENLQKFSNLVSRTAPAFLDVESEVLDAHLNKNDVQEQLISFLEDPKSHLAVLSVLNGQVRVYTTPDSLNLEGEGIGYLKRGTGQGAAFHLLNLGDLAKTSLSGILGPVFGHLDALRRQVSAGDASKVILGDSAKISSFETKINSKDQATAEDLFRFERALIDLGSDADLKGGIASELSKKVLLPEDCFVEAEPVEGQARFIDIIAYIQNTTNILSHEKGFSKAQTTPTSTSSRSWQPFSRRASEMLISLLGWKAPTQRCRSSRRSSWASKTNSLSRRIGLESCCSRASPRRRNRSRISLGSPNSAKRSSRARKTLRWKCNKKSSKSSKQSSQFWRGLSKESGR